MKHTTKKGLIKYQFKHSDNSKIDWGFEEFRMTCHLDGSRVLRSYCELNDDSKIIRDVIQRVDKDFHPQDSSVRLTVNDQFVGSSWYHFTDTTAELQGITAKDGRINEKLPITRNIRGFGTHALNGDTWLAARYDFSKGPGIQIFKNNLLTSRDYRGATGPALETSESSGIQYFGKEPITVQAGTFLCYHFAFVNLSIVHPPYHFWATSDGNFLFVKGIVEGFNWYFELVELI